MEKKRNVWEKSRQGVRSFLIALIVLFTLTPAVHAEDRELIEEEWRAPEIVRHEGYSRDNVAENVAQAHFSDSTKAILVNREKFPDAISATNISQGRYPVLYTYEGHVTEGTLAQLQAMPLEEIYVLGGELSVNEAVINQLKAALNVPVTRVAGRSRYDANAHAIEKNFGQSNQVVIASGEVYSDALYGVSFANTMNAPVVLTNTNRLEASTVELLKDLNVEQATIIGGTLTVTPEVEKQLNDLGIHNERIAGRNRYIGSAEVASASYRNPDAVVVASGEVFSDALVSAPLAQKLEAPILLVQEHRVEENVEDYILKNKQFLRNVYLQGGPLTISEQTEETIQALATTIYQVNRLLYPTEYEEDASLLEGETELLQEGQTGREEVYYHVQLENGQEVDRVAFDRVTVDPQPEIVRVGTKPAVEEEPVERVRAADVPGLGLSEEELYILADDPWQVNFEYAEHRTGYGPDDLIKGEFVEKLTEEERNMFNNGQMIDETLLNQYFLELINNERKEYGVDALIMDDTLAQGTNQRALELAEQGSVRAIDPATGEHALDEFGNELTHTRPYNEETGEYEKFYTAFEYRNDQPEYYVGENLASRTNSGNPYRLNSEKLLAEMFFQQWKDSPGHYANMLNGMYTGTWVSIKVGDKYLPIHKAFQYAYDNITAVQILAVDSQ